MRMIILISNKRSRSDNKVETITGQLEIKIMMHLGKQS